MMEPVKKHFTRGRSWARRLAMQAIYQWQMTGLDPAAIDAQFQADQDMSKADLGYFQELVQQVPARVQDIDAATQKAKALGAGVIKDVTEVSDMGWLSIITDPTGAALGLWQPKMR